VNKTKLAVNLALVVIVGIGIWLTLEHKATPPDNTPMLTKTIPETLPGFTLKDTDGAVRNSGEWRDKILIVNFWATWCPPCLEEMPTLIDFQKQYSANGVQVIGVAVDNLEQVKSFIADHGINFPVMIGSDDAIALAQQMGNRIAVLPYTAIFDKNGKTLYAQPGTITKELLKTTIKPLL
jgi:peroxiredoxin